MDGIIYSEKGWQESIELSSFISGMFTGFTNLG